MPQIGALLEVINYAPKIFIIQAIGVSVRGMFSLFLMIEQNSWVSQLFRLIPYLQVKPSAYTCSGAPPGLDFSLLSYVRLR